MFFWNKIQNVLRVIAQIYGSDIVDYFLGGLVLLACFLFSVTGIIQYLSGIIQNYPVTATEGKQQNCLFSEGLIRWRHIQRLM